MPAALPSLRALPAPPGGRAEADRGRGGGAGRPVARRRAPACGAPVACIGTPSPSHAGWSTPAVHRTYWGGAVTHRGCLGVRPGRLVAASASGDGDDDGAAPDDALDAAARDALLLCWFGAQVGAYAYE